MKLKLKTKPHLSKYRSISGVAVLSRLLKGQGISEHQLLSCSSIHVDDLNDPDKMVSPEQELSLVRRVIKLSPQPEIGLIAGHEGHVGVNGKLGMGWICCSTFLEVVQMAIRYIDLTLTFFQHEVTIHGSNVYHKLSEIIDLKELRYFIAEREFTSLVRMNSDILCCAFEPKEVHFAFPRPEYADSYQDYFHCPVYFNAKNHLFVFDKKYLNHSLPKADPLMKSIYEKECKQLSQRYRRRKTTEEAVRQELFFSDDNFHDIEEVARRLSMSSRTLRRKLTAEGISYQKILDELRKNKTIDLLMRTNKSNEDIAAIIGYSNTSNFYHAFRRWTGHTPAKYRNKRK